MYAETLVGEDEWAETYMIRENATTKMTMAILTQDKGYPLSIRDTAPPDWALEWMFANVVPGVTDDMFDPGCSAKSM